MKQSLSVAATLLLCTLMVAGCGATSESTKDNASTDNRDVIEGTVTEADMSSSSESSSSSGTHLAKASTTAAPGDQ